MKKAIFTFGMMLLAMVAFNTNVLAQEAAKVGGAEITFETETHDYGTIEQNGNGECEFKFTNTGTEPLTITNAKGSCGCTVPEWPREAIQPGQSSVIKVKYDTKRIGLINKSVTIQSNATNAPTKIIRIKGEVKAPTGDASPVKTEGPVSH